MAELLGIPAEVLPVAWGTAEPLLAKAMERDSDAYTLADLRAAIERRDMQLWLMIDGKDILAAGVSEICIYPRKKVARIRAVGGAEFGRWKDTLAAFEAWARSLGCQGIEFYGRPGWQKLLSDYRAASIVMEKAL